MPRYAFESITAAQALAFSSEDSLTFGVSARNVSVLFLADGTLSVTASDRTVVFNTEFRSLGGSRIAFSDDSQLLLGTDGPDVRDLGTIPSTGAIYAGDGADSLTASPGDWLMQGNQGNDVIRGWTRGRNTIYGGQGDDRIDFFLSEAKGQFAQGNKGNDSVQGGNGGDTLLGGQGDDRIDGAGGADFLNGNLGNDTISGSGQLFGEDGADSLSAFDTATLHGGDGNDTLVMDFGVAFGDQGADTLSGSGQLFGGEGNDVLDAFTGSTTLSGGDGNDAITFYAGVATGDAGDDTITGHATYAATLSGGDGSDVLQALTATAGATFFALKFDGGAGADTLRGANGDDTLIGGAGADVMSGSSGADLFVLDVSIATLNAASADRITDWNSADHLRFKTAGALGYSEITAADFDGAVNAAQTLLGQGSVEVVAVQVGADVLVFADAAGLNRIDTTTVLVGRTLSDIGADNII